jgi:hypothetical protein
MDTPKIKMEREYYPNGQLAWESSFKDGKQVGLVKKWHENGAPKWECPLDDNGLMHGIVKQWNKEGMLLGQYHTNHGTGVEKSWYENGQLERASFSIGGKLCGRFQCWYENGELVSETYYIMDKQVSKKKYIEACKTDLTLPRYRDDDLEPGLTETLQKYKKRETPVFESERQQHTDFINKLLKQPNRGEARQWLAGDDNRNIGEMTPEESREFIDEGYKAGATKILAVEIEEDTTNCLIVYLPSNGAKRKRVFEWNGESAQKSGFDPYEDWGQSELFAYFS